MKKLLWIVILLLGSKIAMAESLVDLGGVMNLVSDVAKGAKGATLIDLTLKPSGALYTPIWTLHSAGENRVDYAELGAGAELRDNKGKPLMNVGINLPALSSRLWSSNWAITHLSRLHLPPIMVGPFVRLPLPGETWLLKEQVGIMVSVSIGGGS